MIYMNHLKSSVVLCRIRVFPTLILNNEIAWVWTTLKITYMQMTMQPRMKCRLIFISWVKLFSSCWNKLFINHYVFSNVFRCFIKIKRIFSNIFEQNRSGKYSDLLCLIDRLESTSMSPISVFYILFHILSRHTFLCQKILPLIVSFKWDRRTHCLVK